MEEQFWTACSNGNAERVKELLQSSEIDTNWQDPEHYYFTPLLIASCCGHIEIVKLLLNDQRVDVNKEDEYGITPFSIACQNGRIEIVKLLLNDNRVDINQANKDGSTPFYLACSRGHIEIVKLLLNDKRIDINQPEGYGGETPFYVACDNGHIEIVKYLVNDSRIDINKEENEGWTPFYNACNYGEIEIVKYLLASGRDLNLTNREGETAIDIARERASTEEYDESEEYEERKEGCQKIVQLLELFEKKTIETRLQLRIQLGFTSKFLSFFPILNEILNFKALMLLVYTL